MQAHLRGSGDEGRWSDKQEAQDDEKAADRGGHFGHQLPVAQPAPAGSCERVRAPVDDKHESQHHGGQFELTQVWLQSRLQEPDAHGRDYDAGRGEKHARDLQHLQQARCCNANMCCLATFVLL